MNARKGKRMANSTAAVPTRSGWPLPGRGKDGGRASIGSSPVPQEETRAKQRRERVPQDTWRSLFLSAAWRPLEVGRLRWAHGFASPPYDEFAFVQDKEYLLWHPTAAPALDRLQFRRHPVTVWDKPR